jgi:hypothetical protein
MSARHDRGAVMIVVVGFLTVLMLLGTGYLYAVRRQASTGDSHRLASQLLYTAEAGAARALTRLADNTAWRAGFTDEPFEGGRYTVSVTASGTDVEVLSSARLAGLVRDVVIDAEIRPGVYEPFTCILFAEGNVEFNVPQHPQGPGAPAEVRGSVASYGSILYDPAYVRINGDETPGAPFDPVSVDLAPFRAIAMADGTHYSGTTVLYGDHSGEDVIFVDGDAVVRNWRWHDGKWRDVDTKLRTLVVDGNVEIATFDNDKIKFEPNSPGGIQRPAVVCTGNLTQRIYLCPDPEVEAPRPCGPGEYDNGDVATIESAGILYVGGDVEFVWIKEECKLRSIIYARGNIRVCLRNDAKLEFDSAHAEGVLTYSPSFDGTEVGGSVRRTAWR